jgi:benzoyl-CoA reductase/2-hydroxyglutaryl-CoA dehydratase subunit BcrC/BadD/HgdB
MGLTFQEIGITSTVPVEIIYAAQCLPVDLNNRFIASASPKAMVEEAERNGLPANICSWVKGLHTAIRQSNLKIMVGVVQGDCTHLQSMLEALIPDGVRFVPFAYPYDMNRYQLRFEIEKLMEVFGVQWDEVKRVKGLLDSVRGLAGEADRRTWRDDALSGRDNFDALVNCSDFKGDPAAFGHELESLLAVRRYHPPANALRLGLLGVPGVMSNLFEFLEDHGARVVYNEVARQFAMPDFSPDLLEQYLAYTYPYSIFGRIADIRRQTELRQLHGYIHYVQSFCHHQIEDLTFRKHLNLPILTLEGDRPGPLDGRTKTRIEAFLEMLSARKRKK